MFSFRKTTSAEADCLQQWHDMPAVYHWVPIKNWKTYFKAVSGRQNYYLYSVYLKNEMVAYIAAEIIDGSVAICLVVDPNRHGQGIGTAVLLEMQRQTESLFGSINAYVAGIFPKNLRSIKCFEKAGFIKTHAGADKEFIYTCSIRR